MHLSTDEPAASRMLEPFGEVGGDAPEYFSSRTHFANIRDNKVNSWSFSQPFMLRAQIWYIELPVKANINIAHTVNVFKSERV